MYMQIHQKYLIRFLMMIESEGGGSGTTENGVDYRQRANASVTSSDGDSTGSTMDYTPFLDGDVLVRVNGLLAVLGNGVKTEPVSLQLSMVCFI